MLINEKKSKLNSNQTHNQIKEAKMDLNRIVLLL